jgi:hypothetical protein
MNEMKSNKNDFVNVEQDERLAEVAAYLAKEQAQNIDFTTQSKLAQARQRAVEHAFVSQNAMILTHSGGVLQWLTGHGSQFRSIATALIFMVVSFVLVQQFNNNNLKNSDAYLLAAELPPEAFADKGFNTWLVSVRD